MKFTKQNYAPRISNFSEAHDPETDAVYTRVNEEVERLVQRSPKLERRGVYVPDQGDIVWLDFDPSSGKEIIKRRPAFVISRKIFNEHTELAIVAPITSNIRGVRLEVVLPKELNTQGAILV